MAKIGYRKAPKYVGKDLTVQVGRADKKLMDGVIYPDSRLARYVGMGFVEQVDMEKEQKAAEAAAKKRVAAKKAAPKLSKADLEKMTKAELGTLGAKMGAELDAAMNKGEMVDAILEAQ